MQYFCVKLKQTNKKIDLVAIISAVEMKKNEKKEKKKVVRQQDLQFKQQLGEVGSNMQP